MFTILDIADVVAPFGTTIVVVELDVTTVDNM